MIITYQWNLLRYQAIGIESESDIVSLGQYFYNQSIEKPDEETPADNDEENDDSTQIENQDSVETSITPPPVVVKQELIHPNDVVKVLRQYVEDNRDPFR